MARVRSYTQYIITGANRGIGLEFVKQLAEEGKHIIATARDPEGASELQAIASVSEQRVRVMQLDVADVASVDAFVKEIANIDVDALINNAGIYPRSGSLGSIDWEMARTGFEVNTIAPLRLAEALLPNVQRSKGKLIMNVTSQMGSIDDNGSGGSYAYRMSKTALNMGTRSLANDTRGDGVIAFVIHPGWVQTDMGGPNASITPEKSVEGMLSVLHGATEETSGAFMNWNGSTLPW